MDQLSQAYDITDVAGKLKYLTIPEETVSDNGVEEGADETEELEESDSGEEVEGADGDNLTE